MNDKNDVKIGISNNSAILRFFGIYFGINIIFGVIFAIVVSFLHKESFETIKIYIIMVQLILNIYITTKIISNKHVVYEDEHIFINKINMVWSILLIISIFTNLYIGYDKTYSDILTLETLQSIYESSEEADVQFENSTNNRESLGKVKLRKKEVIKEDLVMPIIKVSIEFIVQVIMTNTISKKMLFDKKFIK